MHVPHMSWAQCSLCLHMINARSLRGTMLANGPPRSPQNILWLIGLHHSTVKMTALGEAPNIPACIQSVAEDTTTPGHLEWDQTFHRTTSFDKTAIISQQHCNYFSVGLRPPPWLTEARLYYVVLSQFSVSIAFIVTFLLNCNFDLKSLARYLCGVNFYFQLSFKPAQLIKKKNCLQNSISLQLSDLNSSPFIFAMYPDGHNP